MEIIFKNRPAPGLEINETEGGNSFEVVFYKGQLRMDLIFDKRSLGVLLEQTPYVLNSWKSHKFETIFDKFEARMIGKDFGPQQLMIFCRHTLTDGTAKESGVEIPEEACPALIKALERWKENPTL